MINQELKLEEIKKYNDVKT